MHNPTLIKSRYFWGREAYTKRPFSDHYVDCNFKLVNTGDMVFSGLFEDCNFSYTDLKNTIISGEFKNCSFQGVDFFGATFRGPRFRACKFQHAKFTSAIGLWTCRLDEECNALNAVRAYIVWHPERKYHYFQADKPTLLLSPPPSPPPGYSPPKAEKPADNKTDPYHEECDEYGGAWGDWGWSTSTPVAPRKIEATLFCSNESELVV